MSELPERLTRARDLEIHEAQDGLVAFDPSPDRVHHLNHTCAVLLELCDGSRSTDELAALVGDLFELAEPPRQAVEDGLRELLEQGVLVRAAGGD